MMWIQQGVRLTTRVSQRPAMNGLTSVLNRATFCSSSTRLADADPTKPSIANIAQLRKLMPGTSMIKAREALTASGNAIEGALQWLEKDLLASGAKKAAKVGDRTAKEGGVAVCVVSDGAPTLEQPNAQPGLRFDPITVAARAGIVELNCETDFVGRNALFQDLLADLAHTVALFPTLAMEESASGATSTQEVVDISVEQLLAFPLIPRPAQDAASNAPPAPSTKTVGDAILDAIARLGERIHLARASALNNVRLPSADAPRRSTSAAHATPLLVASSFAHGVTTPASSSTASQGGPQVAIGRVGSMLLTRIQRRPATDATPTDAPAVAALRGLCRSLARQAAGMPTQSIQSTGQPDEAETSLYAQSFIMRLASSKLANEVTNEEGQNVQQTLQSWGQAWTGAAPSKEGDAAAVEVLAMRRWQLGESA